MLFLASLLHTTAVSPFLPAIKAHHWRTYNISHSSVAIFDVYERWRDDDGGGENRKTWIRKSRQKRGEKRSLAMWKLFRFSQFSLRKYSTSAATWKWHNNGILCGFRYTSSTRERKMIEFFVKIFVWCSSRWKSRRIRLEICFWKPGMNEMLEWLMETNGEQLNNTKNIQQHQALPERVKFSKIHNFLILL